VAAVVVLVAIAALVAWRSGVFGGAVPQGIVALSGRIEGDDAAVAPKTSGRILDVRVHEGDSVKAGDPIAVLDDEQVRAREEQAQAALAQADARTKAARDQITVLQEQEREALLQTDQARLDAEGRVREAEAELAAADAQLAREQAAYQIAAFDRDAYAKLAKTGAASERQEKQARSTADQQEASVAAAQRRSDASKAAVATARANLANPDIRAAHTAAIRRQIAQQEAEVTSAQAQSAQMRAQLQEARANRADLTVRAPFDGTVATRSAEPGEVVMPGTPIVTLVDLSKVYLRGFVPEGRIGEVKVGQPARVYLDSNPKQPIDAYVSRINPEATFTPENTYFREDRVKQVVGIKVQLKGAVGFAKPGMPADGEILVGSAWPSGGRS
jgi:HlyD family secretion protein